MERGECDAQRARCAREARTRSGCPATVWRIASTAGGRATWTPRPARRTRARSRATGTTISSAAGPRERRPGRAPRWEERRARAPRRGLRRRGSSPASAARPGFRARRPRDRVTVSCDVPPDMPDEARASQDDLVLAHEQRGELRAALDPRHAGVAALEKHSLGGDVRYQGAGRHDGRGPDVGSRRCARTWVDEVVLGETATPPGPEVAARRGDTALPQQDDVQRLAAAPRVLDGDGPRAASPAHGDVAPEVDERRTESRQQRARGVGGPALRGPAEVEAQPRGQSNRTCPPVSLDLPPARDRTLGGRASFCSRSRASKLRS